MTDRARKLLEDAMALSVDERRGLAEELMSSVPPDAEWIEELERRVHRAVADPDGGEPWADARQRIATRFVPR